MLSHLRWPHNPLRPSNAGTVNGIFRSTTGGRTWRRAGGGLPSKTEVPALTIEPNQPTIILAAVTSPSLSGALRARRSAQESGVAGPTDAVELSLFTDSATVRKFRFARPSGTGIDFVESVVDTRSMGKVRIGLIAGVLLSGLIVSQAIWGWWIFDVFRDPWAIFALPFVVWLAAGNELAAQVRLSAGRRLASAAMVADGKHARTDGFVSLGVVVSAVVVALGVQIADPIVGLVITLIILHITWESWREVRHAEIDLEHVDEH
jgi:hypothetical protein